MSSSATKAVSGLLRCKGISKSSGEQCRHTRYDGQYCWTHKDQENTPSTHLAAEHERLGDTNVAISASNNGYSFFRLRNLLLLGFLASLWLTGSVLQLGFSAPEYLGPMDVCAEPESSLDILSQYHPHKSHSRFPSWLNPFMQNPVFEPASLVGHIINETMPTAGAGAQNLTSLQTKGLSMWQNCSKEIISSNFDLQCPFDAFNLLFFGGYLAQVNVGWTESTDFPTVSVKKGKNWKMVLFGVTLGRITPQLHQRHVNITILSLESDYWHSLDSPNVHGVLLHEMVHAYFRLYACPGAYEYADVYDVYPNLRNLGISGHGPEWLRLIRTLEKAASEYLGLGEIDLPWRDSVMQELAHVKSLRKIIAGDQRSEHEEVDKYFGRVISDIDDLLGFKA